MAPLIRVADTTVSEVDLFAQLLVSLSAPSAQTATVNDGTGSGTASYSGDFLFNSGTLTFAPGETTKTVRVALQADTSAENSEVFFFLNSPTNSQLERTSASITLVDKESSGATPQGLLEVCLSRTGPAVSPTVACAGTPALHWIQGPPPRLLRQAI